MKEAQFAYNGVYYLLGKMSQEEFDEMVRKSFLNSMEVI